MLIFGENTDFVYVLPEFGVVHGLRCDWSAGCFFDLKCLLGCWANDRTAFNAGRERQMARALSELRFVAEV